MRSPASPATAVLVALALGACSSAPSGPLPAGTYDYSSNEAGIPLDVTVTVSRDAGAVVVHEDAKFLKLPNLPPIDVETRLDPKTFSTIALTLRNDPEMENPSVAVSASGATVTRSGKPPVTIPPAIPGAPANVDTDWASSYLAIPAMIAATGAKTINVYHTALLRGKGLATPFYVVPATATRPSGAASNDAAVALALAKARRPFMTLWYDPATDVVSAVQMGVDDEVTFVRK